MPKFMRTWQIIWMSPLMFLFMVGCDGSSSTSSTGPADTPRAARQSTIPDMSVALSGEKTSEPSEDANSAAQAAVGDDNSEQESELAGSDAGGRVEEPAEERQVAVAGVGRKGKAYGGDVITEPVSQYFGARERIAFINLQKAMREFQAIHERDPESHDEFMEKVIQEYGIQLPALYEHERYEYDPDVGELMVVRPKR